MSEVKEVVEALIEGAEILDELPTRTFTDGKLSVVDSGHLTSAAETMRRAAQALASTGKGEGEAVVSRATGATVPGPHTKALVEQVGLHHATAALVNRMAFELAWKLHRAEQKYGYSDGWKDEAWEDECRRQLHYHAAKGDPLDVIAYAAFCWHHGWSSALPVSTSQGVGVDLESTSQSAIASAPSFALPAADDQASGRAE
jgi:hypothetical protein